MAATLAEYVASQDDLLKEASLALPHQFSQCTYALGPIRQAVYLCLTCPERRGLCSACSIACHTDHDQIELFPKRNFRCDCPTSAIAHPCTLHTRCEDDNVSNQYGQNFQAVFCRCGRPYDANKELETMIQCLACEDWFHESCCNLRERPPSRSPTPVPVPEEVANKPSSDSPDDSPDNDDAASEASSSGLPPPLISASDYESLVCGSCVSKIPTLQRWAGTPGILMVTRDDASGPWKRIGGNNDDQPINVVLEVDAGTKRPLSPSAETPEAKRARASDLGAGPSNTPRCLAPPPNPTAQKILAERVSSGALGTGDIFLTEGFQTRWCRCDSCLPSLQANPYLLEEEETYEPPEDPDSGLSLEELGMRALERIPRDRAIDGIHAFNAMRDNLVQYLRPFAQEGKVVNEADVRSFFDDLKKDAVKKSRT